MFTIDPAGAALLLRGTSIAETLWVIATSFAGVFAFAAAASGWLLQKTTWVERTLLGAAGLCLVHPAVWADIAGLALVGLVILLQLAAKRRGPLPAE
jgi:TRAP-type uncharacterized transport system fused permease subunit